MSVRKSNGMPHSGKIAGKHDHDCYALYGDKCVCNQPNECGCECSVHPNDKACTCPCQWHPRKREPVSKMYQDRFEYGKEAKPMPLNPGGKDAKPTQVEMVPMLPDTVEVSDLLDYHALRSTMDDNKTAYDNATRNLNEFIINLGKKYSLLQGDEFNYRTGIITRKARQ